MLGHWVGKGDEVKELGRWRWSMVGERLEIMSTGTEDRRLKTKSTQRASVGVEKL